MKYLLISLLLPFYTIAQRPAFFLNEGLINDNALFIGSKNWLVCYPTSGSGGLVVGERISIWDIANGNVVKNISIGNEWVMDVFRSSNEKYLTIKYRGKYEVYSLESLQLLKTIERNPNYESFLYISETAKRAFYSDSAYVTKVYDLTKPAAAAKKLREPIGYYDWFPNRIVADTLLISRTDTIEALSLLTEQKKILLTKQELAAALDNTTGSMSMGWYVNLGNKVLVKVERYGQPNMLALYDPVTKKVISSVPIPFRDYTYHISDDKKRLILFSEHYAKESFENGYKFLSVGIADTGLSAELIHFQGLDSLKDFSVAYEKWKYGIYTMYDHLSKFVYIYDSKTNKKFVLKKAGNLPKIEILSDELVLYQTQNLDSVSIFELPLGKEYILDKKERNIYTTSEENPRDAFHFYTKEKDQYGFYKWIGPNRYKRVFNFSSFSLKVTPQLTSKIGSLIRCEFLFSGESLNEVFSINSPVYKTRNTELEFNTNSGSILLATKPTGRNVPVDLSRPVSGMNVYSRLVLSSEKNMAGYYNIDSVQFFDKFSQKQVAAMQYDTFTNLTGIYQGSIGNMEISSDSKRLLICGMGGADICQLAIQNNHLQLLNKLKLESYPFYKLGYCNNNKNIYQVSNNGLLVFDANTGRFLTTIKGEFTTNCVNDIGTAYITIDKCKRNIEIGDIDRDDKKLFPWKNQQWIFNEMSAGISKFGQVAYSYEATGDLTFYDLKTKQVIQHITLPFIVAGNFLDSTNFLYFSKDNIPVLYNYRTKTAKAFQTNLSIGALSTFYHSPEDHLLLSFSTNNIYVWDLKSCRLKYHLIIADTAHYLIQNNDGYYTYNKIEFNQVKCRVQNELLAPQELDFIYNRPDLFASDTANAAVLYKLHLKRLYNNGINSHQLNTESFTNRIQCKIAAEDNNTNVLKKSDCKLHVQAKGGGLVAKLFVYINGVPVIDQPAQGTGIEDTSFVITLEKGENKIVTFYLGANGIKSNYAEKMLFYEPADPATSPQTWFVGLGISEYADRKMKLRYAKKDILGLDSLFKQKIGGAYHSLVFTDSAVVPEKIHEINQWLLQSHPEDHVIIAVSGHGLIDDSLNFFFATYNTTAARPSGGISYNKLESLFDGVQARKRLLFVDACHSGAIDNATRTVPDMTLKKATLGEALSLGKERTLNQVKTGGVGLQESFELMRNLFADVNLGKGILVLAAARGSQVANEGDQWNNGAFTYCIKEGLKGMADFNGDGLVSVSELSTYITTKVPELTGGKQIPTLNTEPAGKDWNLW